MNNQVKTVKRQRAIIGFLLLAVIILLAALLYSRPDHSRRTGQPGSERSSGLNKVLAQVGSRQIEYSDLKSALEERYGAETLNQMIDQEAVAQEARSLGLSVSDEEVETELKWMQQGYDSEEEYYASMKEQLGLSKAQLFADTHQRLLLEKVATNGLSVSEDEVNKYMKDHPEEFDSIHQVHLQQIIVETKELARLIIKQLNNGSDFALIARESSIDEVSSSAGGDLGWIGTDDPFTPDKILAAVRSLETGEISSPIDLGEDGYAVVKLLGRKTLSDAEIARLKAKVKKDLLLGKAPALKDVVKSIRTKRNVVIYDPRFSNK